MEEVSRVTAQTLRLAKMHGTVVLVTNAERGWIELSCQKFMPSLLPHLADIPFVSARSTYEGPDCPSPLDWKLKAFGNEVARFFGSKVVSGSARKNVVSLGDSVHEREALLRVTKPLPNCVAKSLKFVDRPDLQQLLKQHNLIAHSFKQIVHHEGNLDLLIRC